MPKRGPVRLGVRPEFISVAALTDSIRDEPGRCLTVPGTVAGATFFGDHRLYPIKAGNYTFTARAPLAKAPSGEVFLLIPIDRLCVFPRICQADELASSVP